MSAKGERQESSQSGVTEPGPEGFSIQPQSGELSGTHSALVSLAGCNAIPQRPAVQPLHEAFLY